MLFHLQAQLSHFLRKPHSGSWSITTEVNRRVPSCSLSGPRDPRDYRPLAREGQTRQTAGTGSPRSLPPGRVTTAGRQHTEGPGAGRGLVISPPRRRSRRLPAPPQAGRLQTAATPGSYQPPDSGIGACSEPAEAPAHSPPAEQARFRRPSRERARKTRGRGGGRGYAGRGGAAAFREARSKPWNPRSLAAGVRSGAGGKPLALLSRDRGQDPSGCLARGFL